MYGYIYITINLISNKKYIGKHKGTDFDRYYKGSGINLQKAIKKYGYENFETKIIEKCYSDEELNEREIYWINYYNAVNDRSFYNIAEGGTGGNTYAGKTEEEMIEIANKISEGLKGSNNGNKGQYIGEKNSFFGKHHTEEAKERIRKKLKGRPKPEGHGEKVSKGLKGKVRSKEHCENLSKALKGKPGTNNKKISIINIETNEIRTFESITAMINETGCCRKTIKRGRISKGYKLFELD